MLIQLEGFVEQHWEMWMDCWVSVSLLLCSSVPQREGILLHTYGFQKAALEHPLGFPWQVIASK